MRPQESGGRLVNCFADKAPKGAPSDIIYRRSPGLRRLVSIGNNHTRGFLNAGTQALWIKDDFVYQVNDNFSVGNNGALAGTKPVTTAKNNAGTPGMVVVTENGCFKLSLSGIPVDIAEPGLPPGPTSVCDYNGYFVWSYPDGKIFASNLNSFTVASNSFAVEQGLFVRRVVRFAGRLFAFGDQWTGVYRDVGSVPFPFSREVTIPRGIIGTFAIAGWETGWANELVWAGDDFIVYKLQGYTPIPVSNDSVSRDIAKSALDGVGGAIEASVYMYGRHAFWTLTSPGRWTWEYNITTGEWNERKSYLQSSWRGRQSLRIFNRFLIGDATTNELYEITGQYFKESNDPLIFSAESGVAAGFPEGMVIPRADFAITTGVGQVGIDSDPTVAISWSLDGGHNYGFPVHRNLGNEGETRSHPFILNCGLSTGQGIRFLLEVADPIHVGLSGGKINAVDAGPG